MTQQLAALLAKVEALGCYDRTPFAQIVVTGTGFVHEERANLRVLCHLTGIKYCGELCCGFTTHLVLKEPGDANRPASSKISRAHEWQIPVLSLFWLLDSIAAGVPQPLPAYQLLPSAAEDTPASPRQPSSTTRGRRSITAQTEEVRSPCKPVDNILDRLHELSLRDTSCPDYIRLKASLAGGDQPNALSWHRSPPEPPIIVEPTSGSELSQRSSPQASLPGAERRQTDLGGEEASSAFTRESPPTCVPGVADELHCEHRSLEGSIQAISHISHSAIGNCSLDTWIPLSQPRDPPTPGSPLTPLGGSIPLGEESEKVFGSAMQSTTSHASRPPQMQLLMTYPLTQPELHGRSPSTDSPLSLQEHTACERTTVHQRSGDFQDDHVGSGNTVVCAAVRRRTSPAMEQPNEPIQWKSTDGDSIDDDSSSDGEFSGIVVRARAPLPDLPPLPTQTAADAGMPLVLLRRAPRGSTVKARYRLTNLKAVQFAEEIYLRDLQLRLRVKQEHTAVVVTSGEVPRQDSFMIQPLAFYRVLGEDWQVEYFRFYTGSQARALAQEEGAPRCFALPPGFDEESELLRSTSREHVALLQVKDVSDVRRVRSSGAALRVKSLGSGGTRSFYWRHEFDPSTLTVVA